MYLATKPSNPETTSATHLWYAPITSRRSSGSRREASAVEPARSQNITVSCRRSAPVGAGDSGGTLLAATGATAPSAAIASSSLRRSPTKLMPRSFRSSTSGSTVSRPRSCSRERPARTARGPDSAASRQCPSSRPRGRDRACRRTRRRHGLGMPSADRQHQMFVHRSGPHHIRLRRIGLGLSRIAIQHRGTGSNDHYVRPGFDSIVVGFFLHCIRVRLLAPPSPRSIYMNPTLFAGGLYGPSRRPPTPWRSYRRTSGLAPLDPWGRACTSTARSLRNVRVLLSLPTVTTVASLLTASGAAASASFISSSSVMIPPDMTRRCLSRCLSEGVAGANRHSQSGCANKRLHGNLPWPFWRSDGFSGSLSAF
jgi:hypothetical protein